MLWIRHRKSEAEFKMWLWIKNILFFKNKIKPVFHLDYIQTKLNFVDISGQQITN